jgi:hypothetical protein
VVAPPRHGCGHFPDRKFSQSRSRARSRADHGQITGSVPAGRSQHQAWVAADGSGRADGSRHRRCFLDLAAGPGRTWSGPRCACRQTSAEKSGINLPQNHHLTYDDGDFSALTRASHRRRPERSGRRRPRPIALAGSGYLSASALAKIRTAPEAVSPRADDHVQNVPGMSNVSDYVRSNVQYVRLN